MRTLALYAAVLVACASFPSQIAATACVEGDSSPHPTNCNAFYVCAGNQQVLRFCPATLHFNPTLEVCDWPAAAGCSAAPPTPANDCPALGGHIVLPHPNCRRFYACDYGTPIERQCSGQLEWNDAAGYCDWPHEAGCVEGVAREQPGAVLLPGGGSTDAPTTVVTADAETTETVTEPAYEKPLTTRTTPRRPATQPPPTKPTQKPDEPATQPPPTKPATQAPVTQRPTEPTRRPTEPTQRPTEPTKRPTPTTTPKPTKAPKPETTPKPPKTPKPTKPAATTPEPTTESTTPDPTETTVDATTPVWSGYDCAVDNDNDYEFLPHPTCQKFYICVAGIPVVLVCPDGFHYSATLQHCVQEKVSTCVDGAAPYQFAS